MDAKETKKIKTEYKNVKSALEDFVTKLAKPAIVQSKKSKRKKLTNIE